MKRNNSTLYRGLSVSILCLFSLGIYLRAQSLPRTDGFNSQNMNDFVVDKDIESAVLLADWPMVARFCGAKDTSRMPSVLRKLYAFSCVALNRNNDAIAAFLSASDPNDLIAWNLWTESFVQRYPTYAIAQFLRGDAAARLQRFDSALSFYTEALRLESDLTLARVARGVAYANTGLGKEAYDDLVTACKTTPPLAEAYTSLGTLIIRSGLQPEDANECYEKALSLSPGSVLALNGLGCVKYAMGEWEKAPAYFVEAGRKFSLPLFFGNLRAVIVAIENLNMHDQDNSPLFRFSDFYDWDALRAKTAIADDIFRTFLGFPLPPEPNIRTLRVLNKALETPGFFSTVRDRLDMSRMPQRLKDSIESTRLIQARDANSLCSEDQGKIILLNRLVLEYVYPYHIARHDQRDPGMQLTLTRGLMDQMEYKRSLTPRQIAEGQWRVDHFWRPFADALESTHLPITDFMGKQLNDHLDFTTHTNALDLQRRGISLDSVRPGGVKLDLSQAYIDTGNWPVTNWFGLMQTTSYPPTPKAK